MSNALFATGTEARRTPARFDAVAHHYNWQYPMLPAWSAQRREYETLTPKLWKHRQLPGWIAELEARLAVIDAEELAAQASIQKSLAALEKAKKSTGENRRDVIKLAEGTVAHWLAIQSELKRERPTTEALIEAHRLRYRQGVEMYGFENGGC